MRDFLKSEDGAVMIEFALVLCCLAIPMIAGGAALAPVIDTWLIYLTDQITEGRALLTALEAAS